MPEPIIEILFPPPQLLTSEDVDRVLFVEIDAIDPFADSPDPLNPEWNVYKIRWGEETYHTYPTDPEPNKLYDGRLIQPISIESSIWSPERMTGHSIPTYGNVVATNLADIDGQTLNHLRSYITENRPFRSYIGGSLNNGIALPKSEWIQLLEGTCSSHPLLDEEKLTIQISDDQYHLDHSIQRETYDGYCADFIEESAYINFGDQFDHAGTFLKEFWYYVDSNAVTHERIIFNKSDFNSSTLVATTGYLARIGKSDTFGPGVLIFTSCHPGQNNLATPQNTIKNKTWHKIGIKYNVTTGIKSIYVDKAEVVNSGSGLAAIPANSINFTIGGGVGNNSFIGKIDNFEVWGIDKTLTDFRINTYLEYKGYNAVDGLMGSYNFNENEGTTLQDQTDNNRDGTFIGNVTWAKAGWAPDTIKEFVIPICEGEPGEIEPILVDPVDLVYIFGDGASQAVDTVYHDGVVWTLNVNYVIEVRRSIVRLLTAPTGKITIKPRGSTNGGYVNKHADIIKKLLIERAEIEESKINADGITTVNTAHPGVCGIFIDGRTDRSILDVINELEHGPFLVSSYTQPESIFLLEQFGIPTETVQVELIEDYLVGEIIPERPTKPAWKIRVGYARNYSPMTKDEAAHLLQIDTARYEDATKEYKYIDDIEDKQILKNFPDAGIVTVNTLFKNEADARAAGLIWFNILSKQREILRGTFTIEPITTNLNKNARLTLPFLQLENGGFYKIVKKFYYGSERVIQLSLWGREVRI